MRSRSQDRKRRRRALGISSQIVEVLESRQLLASIAEFGGLTSGASPGSITQGPNNDLWFVQSNRAMLGQFTPGVGLTEHALGPSTTPAGITLGPDGQLWYTRPTSDKIGRMTPTGDINTFDVAASSAPHEIIVGPDGKLWFTEPGIDKIGTIDKTGHVTEYGGLTTGSQPASLTVGPDGNIWFTQIGANSISSIVASGPNAGTVTEYSLPGGLVPNSITTGTDGNLWFTDATNNMIGRFTTGGAVTAFTIPTSNASPGEIVSGPGGNLYFTMPAGNAIGRISLSGLITEYTIPTSASSPTGITVGPDGHVWFTEAAADKLGRLNLEPTAGIDIYVVYQDQPLTVNATQGVLSNDNDPESDAITAVIVGQPANGTVTLSPDGSFTYTPNTGYAGADSFTYKANDGADDSDITTVYLSIRAETAPVAVADAYSTNMDAALTVNALTGVLANDTDADTDPLTAVLVDQPLHGYVSLNADGSFTFTPFPAFTGTDSFTYKVNDGILDGNTVTVNLTVRPLPTAVADSYTVNQDSTLTVDAAGGVLANDTDANGDTLTANLFGLPTNGSAALNADGSFTYVPNIGYFGPDSFTYKASDGTTYGNATNVHITVRALPVEVDDSYSTARNAELIVNAASGVLANDTSPDGYPLFSYLAGDVSHGTLTLNIDGSFTYTPDAGYQGPDSFTYWSTDGDIVFGDVVTVNITVGAPPVATDDVYATTKDQDLTISGPGVLVNDTDADGDEMTAVKVTDPAHGSLTLYPDGSFEYTPDPGYVGNDSFAYKAFDGNDDSNVATVHSLPVGINDSYTVAQGTILTVNASGGVLANDIDADGDTLTASVVDLPDQGVLSLNPDGSFTYTPDVGYFGPDSFAYKANDGIADGNTATVSIKVDPVNHAPVATPDAYTTAENSPLTISGLGVLANDIDPDGDPITAVLVDGPSHGTLTLLPDGSFVYLPATNFNGNDSFRYQAHDGTVAGNIVTVSLTVTPVNQSPLVYPSNLTATQGTPLNGVTVATFTGADVDEYPGSYTATIDWGDGTPATAGGITRSGNMFTVNSDHVYNSNGTFNITITVNDPAGGVGSNTGLATVAARVDPPSTPLTGAVASNSQMGPLGVPITNNNTPTIRGTGPAGQLVTLYAVASGPMAIGQAVIGVDGTYQITSAAMPDGTYTLAIVLQDPARPGESPTAVQWLGALTVDTSPPTIIDAHYDVRTRRFFVTFTDVGSGLDLNTVLDTTNYLVALPISRTARANVVPLTGTKLVSFSNGTATVAISAGNRPRLRRGQSLFTAFSRSITDHAGNALAGQFPGSFPTRGPAGTNFVTRYEVIGRRISPPQPAPFLTRIAPRWVNRLRRVK